MRPTGVRGPLAGMVAAAVALGVGLVALALVTARTLSERNDAVRQGILFSLAHELESALREAGPDGAAAAVEAFGRAHGDALRGIEVVGAVGRLAEWGQVGADAWEAPLALGRGWGGGGWRGGMGMGARGGTGMPPWRARLAVRPEVGGSSVLPRVVIAGALLAAAALVAFAVFAARGLAQRQRLAIEEAERERLATVATAGAGLAHRIRNPLAVIKGTAQLLAEQVPAPQRPRAERLVEASERIEALLGDLLRFARPPEAQPERLDLGALVAEVVARVEAPASLSGPQAVAAFADRAHVESILEELLANARAFDVGELEVAVGTEGRRAFVEVRDRGPGPGPEPDRVFEPYVTSRPEGTGLGLAVVRTLARANRGEVTLAPRGGGGAVARLELPVAEG